MSLKEKFQFTVIPSQENAGEPWASFESQRNTHGVEGCTSPDVQNTNPDKYNHLPPGMDIDNQERPDGSRFVKGFGGDTDVSDQRNFANQNFLKEGFNKLKMKNTDDQYTGEHVDLFYGDAGGFVERNNYMDRE